MFDLGMSEMLVVGTVALIVVGPKDLPGLFRTVGRFVGKAKGMAREFSSAMNDAADETGMRDIAKGLKATTNPVGSVMNSVKEATRDLTSSIDPTKFGADTETGKLSVERAEKARKIQASTARMAAERKEREAQEALAKTEEAVLVKKPPAKKPTAKKSSAKKTASKTGAKTAVKTAVKTAAKTSKAKTSPAKKAPVKKAVAKAKIKAEAKPAAKAKGTT